MNPNILQAFALGFHKVAATTYPLPHPKHGRVFYAETDKPKPKPTAPPTIYGKSTKPQPTAPPKFNPKHAREEPFTIRREVPIKGIRVGKTAMASAFMDELQKIALLSPYKPPSTTNTTVTHVGGNVSADQRAGVFKKKVLGRQSVSRRGSAPGLASLKAKSPSMPNFFKR